MASSLGLVHPALPTRTASASPLPRHMDFRSLKGQARVWRRSLPTPSCAEAPLCPPCRQGRGRAQAGSWRCQHPMGSSGAAGPDGRFRVSSSIISPTEDTAELAVGCALGPPRR